MAVSVRFAPMFAMMTSLNRSLVCSLWKSHGLILHVCSQTCSISTVVTEAKGAKVIRSASHAYFSFHFHRNAGEIASISDKISRYHLFPMHPQITLLVTHSGIEIWHSCVHHPFQGTGTLGNSSFSNRVNELALFNC